MLVSAPYTARNPYVPFVPAMFGLLKYVPLPRQENFYNYTFDLHHSTAPAERLGLFPLLLLSPSAHQRGGAYVPIWLHVPLTVNC